MLTILKHHQLINEQLHNYNQELITTILKHYEYYQFINRISPVLNQ